MKIFRMILVIGLVAAISFLSWSLYTSKSLQEKHEKAKLVLEESLNIKNISEWRDYHGYA